MIYANLRPTVTAVFLLIGASSAAALQLQQSSGTVLLGRPLEFNVPTTLSDGENAGNLCLEADVSQGDTAANPVRVNAQLLKSSTDGLSTLRVSSSTAVQDPVLTIVIRYGCVSKNSRRYVVFADPPVSVNESSLSANGAAAFGLSSSTQLAQAPALTQAVAGASRASGLIPKNKSTSIVAGPLAKSLRLESLARVKGNKPRLQLDGVDSTVEQPARLRSTSELFVVPSESSSTQRLEAAALWRVIGAQPEDLRQDIQLLSALQAETLALRDASTKNIAEVTRLSVQVKDAEANKYQNPLVYGLLALLALLLAGFAFMRFGSKNENAKSVWWNAKRDKNESDDRQNFAEHGDALVSESLAPHREPVIPSKVKPVIRMADRKGTEMFAAQPKFQSSESAYALLSAQGGARDVNVEELFDIQQQADFFISLGQHDQAIEVLQNHIIESTQTSPLVYLDLLKLYHRQLRRLEYQELAVEFTRQFNADVPEFDAFQDQTLGLEAYEATLSQIVLAWHTQTVLKVIENSVFREVGRISEALDLEAYRELLLLHSIAKDLAENQPLDDDADRQMSWSKTSLPDEAAPESIWSHGNFNQTIPQELTPVINAHGGTSHNSSRSVSVQKPLGTRIGLDIDLSASAPDDVFDRPGVALENGTPYGTPEPSRSGLIEFELESLDASGAAKVPKT